MIDTRYVELKKGSLKIRLNLFTQDYKKDVYLLVGSVGELLDKSIPFNKNNFTIDQYSETDIVVKSRKNVFLLHIDNIYPSGSDLYFEYRFFLYKEK
jgi:hypothetical protein